MSRFAKVFLSLLPVALLALCASPTPTAAQAPAQSPKIEQRAAARFQVCIRRCRGGLNLTLATDDPKAAYQAVQKARHQGEQVTVFGGKQPPNVWSEVVTPVRYEVYRQGRCSMIQVTNPADAARAVAEDAKATEKSVSPYLVVAVY